MKSLGVLLIAALGLHVTPIEARSQQELSSVAQVDRKLYVAPDQIEITEEGILFYDAIKESIILAETLSYDEKGLYIQPQRGPCNLHREWCKYCHGCGVLYCPMKCQCPYGGGG